MTVRLEFYGPTPHPKAGALWACWHGRGLVALFAHFPAARACLVSAHRDGQLVGQLAGWRGWQVLVGSSGASGLQALRQVWRALATGQAVLLTPDGPRGPRQIAQPGVALLAQRAGCQIIPVSLSAQWAIRLRSWDHYLLPLPGSRVVVVYGAALPATTPLAAIADALTVCQDEADTRAGQPLTPPATAAEQARYQQRQATKKAWHQAKRRPSAHTA